MSAIEILFRVKGQAELDQALAGIGRSLDRLASNAAKSADASVRERVTAEKNAAKEIEKAAKDAEKAKKAADKASAQATKEHEKEAVKAAKEALAEIARERKAAQRQDEQSARESSRIRNAINNLEVREYLKGEREKTAAVEAEWNKRNNSARRTGQQVGGAVSRVLGTAGRVAAGIVGLGGGFTIADSVQTGIANETAAGQIVRSSNINPDNLNNADLTRISAGAATNNGMRSADVLPGLDAFVKQTGDLKSATALIGDIAKLATVSGAAMSDMGATTAAVFRATGGNIQETIDVMKTLVEQGRKGAIEIRDLGQYGNRLTGSAGFYEGGVANNIKSLGSIAQIARQGTAVSPAEATESALRIFDEVLSHKDKFESLMGKGAVTGSNGLLKAPEEILIGALVAGKGAPDFIPKLLGRQAGRAEEGLWKEFLKGSGGKTDAESLQRGADSAREAINSNKAPISDSEIERLHAQKMEETQSKLNVVLENFYQKINAELIPALTQLIPLLAKLIDPLSTLIGFLSRNPFAGVGIAMGAAIALEVGKAQLADKLAEGFRRLYMSASGAGTTPPGAGTLGNLGGGAGGGGAAARNGVSGGAVALMAAAMELDREKWNAEGDPQYRMGTGGVRHAVDHAAELAKKITSGTATESEKKEAQQSASEIEMLRNSGSRYREEGFADTMKHDLSAAGKNILGDGSEVKARTQASVAAGNMEKLAAAAELLNAALAKVAATAESIDLGPSGKWPQSDPHGS